jgi:uncharacterized protein (DUF849 family)
MADKTILTCAVTGSVTPPTKHPGLPITPAEIAASAIEAGHAGAAVVHIHVRDPKTGAPSLEFDYYREVVERIREDGIDVLINLTTGPGARFIPSDDNPEVGAEGTAFKTPEFRARHVVELKPDLCSLDYGSMNFGDFVFMNTPAHLEKMALAVREAGVKPELEVFDTGHLRLAKRMLADGILDQPAMFQICLGIPWGAEQTSETMLFMRNQLPAGSEWAGFGIGSGEFPMLAQAALLGGHVRVGMEDNLYLDKGVPAPSNAALVEKGINIVRTMGREVASPDDARKILGLA